jgi:hypothetical protein
MGLIKQRSTQASRRVKAAVVRSEFQPYSFIGQARTPRLHGGGAVLWCVPSASIAAGTYPPSGAPGGPLTGQTIYSISAAGYTALPGTFSLYNPHATGLSAGKLAAVTPNDDGSWSVVDQDC